MLDGSCPCGKIEYEIHGEATRGIRDDLPQASGNLA